VGTDIYTIRKFTERYSGVGKWSSCGCKEGVGSLAGLGPSQKEMRKEEKKG
jgi:hypothetical protein